MGKTVPTYRMAIESEIANWKGFRDGLASEEERQSFDQVMDLCRIQAMAGSSACNPVLFEPTGYECASWSTKNDENTSKKNWCLINCYFAS